MTVVDAKVPSQSHQNTRILKVPNACWNLGNLILGIWKCWNTQIHKIPLMKQRIPNKNLRKHRQLEFLWKILAKKKPLFYLQHLLQNLSFLTRRIIGPTFHQFVADKEEIFEHPLQNIFNSSFLECGTNVNFDSNPVLVWVQTKNVSADSTIWRYISQLHFGKM